MSKRRPIPGPTPLGEIFSRWLKPADWRQLELHSRLRQAWEETVSPALRAQTQLLDYKKKTLLVAVGSHAAHQELQFLKPALLAGMQRLLGPQDLKDIQFRLP